MLETNRVLIAMSGGVDSAVATYLLVRQGMDCMGATMRLYHNEDIGQCSFRTCCSQRDIDDAAEVAFDLDIPYEVVDFTVDFKEKIMGKFVATYESGGTPNPCIDCNRYMKFDQLLRFARDKECAYIATGHYARIEEKNGRFLLKKALDLTKDQSYVLYAMTQDQLRRTLFPLGGMTKTQTREIAQAQGLVNAKKPDSQDICFVPDGDYVKFMEQYTGKRYPEGDFIDSRGTVVGRHKGIVRYTIGQRKGLGIALGSPVYVYGKDMATNTVLVGDPGSLQSMGLIANDVKLIAFDTLTAPIRAKAKTRYHQEEQWANVFPLPDGEICVVFDEPQAALAQGQAVVLYQGDLVLGGGTISKVLK